jgi:hypothetical protein
MFLNEIRTFFRFHFDHIEVTDLFVALTPVTYLEVLR